MLFPHMCLIVKPTPLTRLLHIRKLKEHTGLTFMLSKKISKNGEITNFMSLVLTQMLHIYVKVA